MVRRSMDHHGSRHAEAGYSQADGP